MEMSETMSGIHSTGEAKLAVALTVDDVTASYTEDGIVLLALERISFSVAQGQFVAIVGPSGSGKSTLLDIVAGLIEPDKGTVFVNGTPSRASERLGHAAYMKQRDLLLPWRTAVGNAAAALQVQGISRGEAEKRATERFAQFGLSGFEKSYPAQLSGGMRQRVAFVRTMLTGQSLLLLDEPFGSLDALTRMSSQEWLANALGVESRTVLLVTHDVDEAIVLADEVLVFSGRPGSIVHSEPITAQRPRNRSFLASSAFNRHRKHLLAALGLVSANGST
ncbi:ABC transporter ATP-binding protein [soil metagenome]